jgi:hypothetical protein
MTENVYESADRSPEFNKSAFLCPHCGAFAGQSWHLLIWAGGGSISSEVHSAMCVACSRQSLWQQGGDVLADGTLSTHKMIFPSLSKVGPWPPEDLPEEVLPLYEEARDVAGASPRADLHCCDFAWKRYSRVGIRRDR